MRGVKKRVLSINMKSSGVPGRRRYRNREVDASRGGEASVVGWWLKGRVAVSKAVGTGSIPVQLEEGEGANQARTRENKARVGR